VGKNPCDRNRVDELKKGPAYFGSNRMQAALAVYIAGTRHPVALFKRAFCEGVTV
jgi:hypothetical protein